MLISHTLIENLKFNAVIWSTNSRSIPEKKVNNFCGICARISSVNHKNLHIKIYMYVEKALKQRRERERERKNDSILSTNL